MRTIRLDRVEIDETKKIRESEDAVVVPAIRARADWPQPQVQFLIGI